MQVEVVTVKFNKGGRGYWFNPNGLNLNVNDKVIVETDKGRDVVKVVRANEMIEESQLSDPLKNVVKMADDDDLKKAEENYKKAESLYPEIKKMVEEERLEMKVISVECNYNFSRLTVNFTAENRVDFRDLVKKLTERFKTRIELRQIGPRDASRILGGLGICGKECCCSQGVGINDHVSIKMVKNQNLSLNPNSISGVCGKLLCCLAYENPYYVEVLKEMPKVNMFVTTPDGRGKVIYNDLLKKCVSVKFEDENSSEIKVYELKDIEFNK